MYKIIAACGNDCATCPRYVAHPYEKTDEECFEITKSFEPMCKQVCTEEEYARMKAAFLKKN